jgi:CheY-like chemotaxis protein
MTQVLTVDDSASTRHLIRMMLESEGYTVSEASDGLEGLEALRASAEPTVVLLDYEMPNMTGGELLEVVAESGGALSQHEFIIVSAHAGTFPIEFIDILRHLDVRMLPKPFEQPALIKLVAQAVERINAPQPEPLPDLPDSGQPNGEGTSDSSFDQGDHTLGEHV